jgi:hypothetical protein
MAIQWCDRIAECDGLMLLEFIERFATEKLERQSVNNQSNEWQWQLADDRHVNVQSLERHQEQLLQAKLPISGTAAAD